jgi:hypothetical protein
VTARVLEEFEVSTSFARRFNMRAIKMFMLSTAASLLLATVAHAEESSRSAEGNAGKAVYEGLDAQGRIVRLTVSDARVETFERVSPAKVRHFPEPHWTSRIGTGTAAEVER